MTELEHKGSPLCPRHACVACAVEMSKFISRQEFRAALEEAAHPFAGDLELRALLPWFEPGGRFWFPKEDDDDHE